MASAWFRQALTTVRSPPKPSTPSVSCASAKLHTLFRASKAYRRTLKLWLKHHWRMTSSALRNCAAFKKHKDKEFIFKVRTQAESCLSWGKDFTSSLTLGRMILKCTRTDKKVQMLVLVFSWSCTDTEINLTSLTMSLLRCLCSLDSEKRSDGHGRGARCPHKCRALLYWTHHAEAGPKAVHVLGIVEQDQNHQPLDQVLDRSLVTAEPSFKHTLQQSGNKLLPT